VQVCSWGFYSTEQSMARVRITLTLGLFARLFEPIFCSLHNGKLTGSTGCNCNVQKLFLCHQNHSLRYYARANGLVYVSTFGQWYDSSFGWTRFLVSLHTLCVWAWSILTPRSVNPLSEHFETPGWPHSFCTFDHIFWYSCWGSSVKSSVEMKICM
jgi:hypothetical protein